MEPDRDENMEPYRQDFATMPGVNGNLVGPSFRDLSAQDTTKRGMMWSSIGVGVLVIGTGIYFLGDWLNWF